MVRWRSILDIEDLFSSILDDISMAHEITKRRERYELANKRQLTDIKHNDQDRQTTSRA